ncbi:PTS mannose/fructose/sorbose/N-acetylgalactosamine transporter subunit IIC [Zophobihabitans entericus]|uniref:PTS sugar transporter subunit IIC n=1 Tax=Zophobihabitans entericus TaxID=1635327 RepID=A0A6G9IDA9_9GAMM|nr:PTS sugar transporter subunit IIC [Zophobihabitans entericus]QIQ21570.1 PTS sugar transporter subunit IIC [Zophobihabitans entericus]
MLVQALLVAAWAGICSLDDVGPQMLRRPLLTGTIVGVIMGDVVQGMAIGATLELMWMGVGNVGAYSSPDTIAGAIIGVALGISTNGGVATGIALAIPVSILCQQLLIIWRSMACFLNPWADKVALTGDFNAIKKVHYSATLLWFLIRAIPCFLALYFGSSLIEKILEMIPDSVLGGLGVASKLIPAVGICILLLMLLKGRMWVFFLLGFILTTYLKLPIIPITFISLAFAVVYDLASNMQNNNAAVKNDASANQTGNKAAEEEYDL